MKPVEHIAICGNGLAAKMTVAALSAQLPRTIRITFVETGPSADTDLFYGTVTSRTAYEFNRRVGVTEPSLLLESDTAFSWGTKYDHWADDGRSWIQCMQLPLPVIDGVLFHHYLAKQGEKQLEKYLIAASAARKGTFVHPPQQPNLGGGQYLLSRAEYGYELDPASYARLFEQSTDWNRVNRVQSEALEVAVDGEGISRLRLDNERNVEADLYVDATGPGASLLSRLDVPLKGERRLHVALSESGATKLGAPMRTASPTAYGWRADTPLQGRTIHLTVAHPDARSEAIAAHSSEPTRAAEALIGKRAKPWVGNCIAIGDAAGVVEPLTPAPILLLERDIERLLALIPVSSDMTMEARENNRRFDEDRENAGLFSRALFETNSVPNSAYWAAAKAQPVPEKLARKLELFEERGVLVSYDLEPFLNEDWTILFYGMGRAPRRYDPSADRVQGERVGQFLNGMRADIEAVVAALPSHHEYMTQLKQYLQRNGR